MLSPWKRRLTASWNNFAILRRAVLLSFLFIAAKEIQVTFQAALHYDVSFNRFMGIAPQGISQPRVAQKGFIIKI